MTKASLMLLNLRIGRMETFKKVVINSCSGGFGISNLAKYYLLYLETGKKHYPYVLREGKRATFYGLCDFKYAFSETWEENYYAWFPFQVAEMPDISYNGYIFEQSFVYTDWDIYFDTEFRESKNLIKVVEVLRHKANIQSSQLKIVEIPSDVCYHIWQNEDGSETIHENHRTWE
jgi:hypothetical protein